MYLHIGHNYNSWKNQMIAVVYILACLIIYSLYSPFRSPQIFLCCQNDF